LDYPMTIAISGNGTITGIATGGLPSGIITANNIVSTSALARGNLPAGTVLQTKVASRSTILSVSGAGDTYASIFGNTSITFTGNNKVLIMAHLSGFTKGSTDARGTLRVYINGGQDQQLARDFGYTMSDPRIGQSVAWYSSTYTAGQTVNFDLYFGTVDGTQVQLNRPFDGAGQSNMVIMEIAQ
jgi:hypothetical protein